MNFLPREEGLLHLEATTKKINNKRAHRSPHSRELILSLYPRWTSGELITALASEVGMSAGALYSRLVGLESEPGFDLDRPNRRPRWATPELVADLHRRHMEGESVSVLAMELRVDNTSIYYQFRQHGLVLRSRVPHPLVVVPGQRLPIAAVDGSQEQLSLFGTAS